MYKIEKMDIKYYEEIIDLWENTDKEILNKRMKY